MNKITNYDVWVFQLLRERSWKAYLVAQCDGHCRIFRYCFRHEVSVPLEVN